MKFPMLSTSTLAQALDSVSRLDRDLSIALGYADVVAAHTYDDARTLWELRRSLEQSVFVARGLREALLADASNAAEDHLEVVLRERNAAIVLRLTELTTSEHEAQEQGLSVATERFQSLRDFNIHVIDQLGKINEACFRARLAEQRWSDHDDPTSPDRRDAYRATLVEALRSITGIGADSDVIRFLRARASGTTGRFSAACRALAVLLDVQLDPKHPTPSSSGGAA